MHIGIDYGSKLAGTTAICFQKGDQLALQISQKKQDADQMIGDFLSEHPEVRQVFIDAPLSLPMVYSQSSTEDFFYRACDREVKAMSPMFLGGLTARAMKLSHSFKGKSLDFFESYPSGLVDELDIDRNLYKKGKEHIQSVTNRIMRQLSINLESPPTSWHEVDALLAYSVGIRYNQGIAKIYGDPKEGLIYV